MAAYCKASYLREESDESDSHEAREDLLAKLFERAFRKRDDSSPPPDNYGSSTPPTYDSGSSSPGYYNYDSSPSYRRRHFFAHRRY